MLRTVTRRLRALAVVLIGAVALTGCYKMSTTTVYHSDGTVDVEILIAMDESLLDESGQSTDDLLTEMDSELTDSPELADLVTVEPYQEDGMAGFTMTMTGVTPEQQSELSGLDTGVYAPESTFTHEDGRIIITNATDPEALAEQDDAIAELDSFGMEMDDLAGFLDFEVRHTFPGPVEETTIGYIDPEDPNTVIIDDLSETVDVTEWTIVASDGTSGSPIATWMWIVGGSVLLLLVAGGLALVLRSRSGETDAVPVASSPYAAPDAAGQAFTPAPPAQTFSPEPPTFSPEPQPGDERPQPPAPQG